MDWRLSMLFSGKTMPSYYGENRIMKNFIREDQLFSLCGLNCGLCSMHLGGYCPGCGGGEENQPCKIAKCSLEHDLRKVMEQVKEEKLGFSIKEEASHMAGLLQEISKQKGISLKLRKKPAKEKEL